LSPPPSFSFPWEGNEREGRPFLLAWSPPLDPSPFSTSEYSPFSPSREGVPGAAGYWVEGRARETSSCFPPFFFPHRSTTTFLPSPVEEGNRRKEPLTKKKRNLRTLFFFPFLRQRGDGRSPSPPFFFFFPNLERGILYIFLLIRCFFFSFPRSICSRLRVIFSHVHRLYGELPSLFFFFFSRRSFLSFLCGFRRFGSCASFPSGSYEQVRSFLPFRWCTSFQSWRSCPGEFSFFFFFFLFSPSLDKRVKLLSPVSPSFGGWVENAASS